MRITIVALLICISEASMAAVDWGQICSNVKTVRAWQAGSDAYGLRIELNDVYSGCEAGFFVPHNGGNKQYVYSTALTAFTTNLPACIQITLVTDTINGNLCKLNQIYLTK